MGNVRRSLGIVAFYSSSLCLVLTNFAGCDQISLSVAAMVLATGLLCFNSSGFHVNHLDLAPRFAGILLGITNVFGTIAGCITPSVTGYFTNDEPTRGQYRKVFLLAAGVSVIGGTFFNVFVSGEQQDWNNIDTHSANKVSVYANDEIAQRIDGGMDERGEVEYLLADSDSD